MGSSCDTIQEKRKEERGERRGVLGKRIARARWVGGPGGFNDSLLSVACSGPRGIPKGGPANRCRLR
jgi:hypothetical protein